MKTLKQRQIETGRTLALNGKAWRTLRAHVLDTEPLCRMCWYMGRRTAATDVDHIDNDPQNDRMDNLQPLCHECHSRKTARDAGKAVYLGCDIHGMPLDPNDPWYREPQTEREKSPAADRPEPPCSPSFNA